MLLNPQIEAWFYNWYSLILLVTDVEIVIKVKGKVVDSKQLNDEYMQWLKLMHDNYDEEVEFLDKDPIYLVEHPASDLLGPDKDLANGKVKLLGLMQTDINE